MVEKMKKVWKVITKLYRSLTNIIPVPGLVVLAALLVYVIILSLLISNSESLPTVYVTPTLECIGVQPVTEYSCENMPTKFYVKVYYENDKE